MSVFTVIDSTYIEKILPDYGLGSLTSFDTITAGIDNTNYEIVTTSGSYIFTIVETMSMDEVEWCVELTKLLSNGDTPFPRLCYKQGGAAIGTYKDKPFLIWKKIKGESIETVKIKHVVQIGENIAKFHKQSVTQVFRPDKCGIEWRLKSIEKLKDKISQDDYSLLMDENRYQNGLDITLPSGTIHGDLFKDNALFLNDTLTGIIDIYYACNNSYIYDLAVIINSWCYKNEKYSATFSQLLLSSYERERTLTAVELELLAVMLRLAALRFWISRLLDFHFPRDGVVVKKHDPDEQKSILLIARYTLNIDLGI